MRICEVCEGPAEKCCGYGKGSVWLDFCTEHYIEHLEVAHPKSSVAQAEAAELRKQLKKSERALRRQGQR